MPETEVIQATPELVVAASEVVKNLAEALGALDLDDNGMRANRARSVLQDTIIDITKQIDTVMAAGPTFVPNGR